LSPPRDTRFPPFVLARYLPLLCHRRRIRTVSPLRCDPPFGPYPPPRKGVRRSPPFLFSLKEVGRQLLFRFFSSASERKAFPSSLSFLPDDQKREHGEVFVPFFARSPLFETRDRSSPEGNAPFCSLLKSRAFFQKKIRSYGFPFKSRLFFSLRRDRPPPLMVGWQQGQEILGVLERDGFL